MAKYITISTTIELVRIAPEHIVYISSDGNYSTLIKADGQSKVMSYQLGKIEQIIEKQLGSKENVFIRVGKQYIVNRSYIHYINTQKQQLVLSDVINFSHTLMPSKEALKQLKEYMEKEAK